MFGFKLVQTIAAVVVMAGFFLPWSRVNFGATVQSAVNLANKVVPGGVANVRNLGDANVAAGAAVNAGLQGGALLKEAKAAVTIPTGDFTGLNLALNGKLNLINFAVPAAALILLLVAW